MVLPSHHSHPHPHTLTLDHLMPIPRAPKRREQEPLREIEDEIEDMDDPEWGPGDF